MILRWEPGVGPFSYSNDRHPLHGAPHPGHHPRPPPHHQNCSQEERGGGQQEVKFMINGLYILVVRIPLRPKLLSPRRFGSCNPGQVDQGLKCRRRLRKMTITLWSMRRITILTSKIVHRPFNWFRL